MVAWGDWTQGHAGFVQWDMSMGTVTKGFVFYDFCF